MRLQHVSISRQIERDEVTRQFYSDLLGLDEILVPSTLQHLNLIWFQLDSETELHIFVEKDIDSNSKRHFCLVVDDLKLIRTKLEESQYTIWDVEEIHGRPRFFVRDPSNNILEFSSIVDDYINSRSNE